MEAREVAKRKDAAYSLAKIVASIKYEDIDKEVVEVTKKGILDTLGAIVAASGEGPGCRELIELVKEGGGKEESTIIAFGGKVTSWMAAFANGAMAHSLDYDDTLDHGAVHPSVCTVPAGFAIAERIGRVSGREFITAVALGNEVICRLAVASMRSLPPWDWLRTPLLGVFSASATCGKLLGLDEEKMVDAFGIALTEAAGSYEMAYDVGSIMRGMFSRVPGKVGVLSALMAQRGITGCKNSLEGRAGLFNAYYGGKYDADSIVADLGKRFECANISLTPWPSCRVTHNFIEATLKMVNQYDIQPEDIEGITVMVDKMSRVLCEPLEARRNPPTGVDARFSIPFTVAIAVARRKVGISEFTPVSIKDQVALRLAQKVTPRFDPQLDEPSGLPPGVVEIRTKGGKTYFERVDYPYGHPRKPMSMEDLSRKFRDCVSYAIKPIPEENVKKVIEAVSRLEEVKDVGQIIQFLT